MVTMSIESLAKMVFLVMASPPVTFLVGAGLLLGSLGTLVRTFGPEVVYRMIETRLPVPKQQVKADEMLS